MFFVTTVEDVAADGGWFPAIGGVDSRGGHKERLGEDGRLVRMPWAQNNYTPRPSPALFPEWLHYSIMLHKRLYDAGFARCRQFFRGCFTLFTSTKVFVWLMTIDQQVGCVAGRGSVVDYARAWLGAGNGGVSTQNTRGHSHCGQPLRSDYTKPAAAEFPHIRSSLQTAFTLKETLAKVTFGELE